MKKKNLLIIGTLLIILTSTYIISTFRNNNYKNNQINKIENSIEENQDLIKSDLKTKEYLDNSDKSSNQHNNKNESSANEENRNDISSTDEFSINKAIEICKNKYGDDSDIEYYTNGKIENLNGKSGYLVQLKSKSLMANGGKGILFTVMVSNEGKIIELE